MNKPKKITKVIITVVVLGAVATGGVYAYQYLNKPKTTRQVYAAGSGFSGASIFEVVKKADVKEIITSSGVVYLKDENVVYSESGEKIKDVLVEEGDVIKEGDEVVTYDVDNSMKSLTKKLKEAEISLENANLNLKTLTLPKTQSEVDKLSSNVISAEKSFYDSQSTLKNTENDILQKEVELEKAEQTIKDNETLLEVGGITTEEYNKSLQAKDDIILAINKLKQSKESNELNLKTSENNLELAKKELAKADVVLSEEADKIKYQQQLNSIKTAELNLADIKDQITELTNSTKSEFNGTVTSVTAEKGKTSAIGTALLTVADVNNLIVKADVSEFDAPKLRIGQYVNMTSDGISGVIYKGKITKIAPSATTKSVSGSTETVVAIEVSVDNADEVLKAGFNLDLDIIVSDKTDVLSVNQSAIQKDSKTKENFVFTVDSERIVRKTPIKLGLYGDLNVEVLEGLKEGDRVITNPTDEYKDGEPLPTPAMGGARGAERNNGATPSIPGGTMVIPGGNMGGGQGGNVIRTR